MLFAAPRGPRRGGRESKRQQTNQLLLLLLLLLPLSNNGSNNNAPGRRRRPGGQFKQFDSRDMLWRDIRDILAVKETCYLSYLAIFS